MEDPASGQQEHARTGINLKTLNFILAGVVVVLGLAAVFVLATPVSKPRPQTAVQEYRAPEEDDAPAIIPIEDKDMPAPETAAGQVHEIRTPEIGLSGESGGEIARFGDWGLECAEVFKEQECHLFQRILWEDMREGEGREAMLVHAVLAPRDGKKEVRLRVIVPLGTFLPPGLFFHLEGEKEIAVNFQFCIEGGCFVTLDLAEDVVATMKKADVLHTAYQQSDGVVGSVDISLKGFTEGLKALEEM